MSKDERSSKRHVFRSLFSSRPKSKVTTPSSSNSNVGLPISQGLSPRPRSETILDKALLTLSKEERTIIQTYLPSQTNDIDVAVDAAYKATLECQKECQAKRRQWKFRGRTVYLQDEAHKICIWLDRVKSIGDVIANVDPIHVGLPWAGVRLILEVAVASAHQTASLLIGVQLALYMANRMKVYSTYLVELPASLATKNFEAALTTVYATILQFLARAFTLYEQPAAKRTLQALWRTDDLTDFEVKCDKLGLRLEIEANNCDRELRLKHHHNAERWKADLNDQLRSLDSINALKDSIDVLSDKVDLKGLVTVEGASYDSFAEEGFARCLDGTRTELLQQIAKWAHDEDGKSIFWLCGMAGTGKSTISRTVASILDKEKHRLGASFFFKRGGGDRGNASRFFPTIAAQLAGRVPGMRHGIALALDDDSRLCEKNLRDQFDKLLTKPLHSAVRTTSQQTALVLVIDALDECDSGDDVKRLLNLLAQINLEGTLRIRIFVTSRPELPIRLGFRTMSDHLHHDVKLEEVQPLTIEDDIRAYLHHQFGLIRTENSSLQTYNPLPDTWPGEDDIEALVQLTVPLFIFASTICRYISGSNPRKRLSLILQQPKYRSLSGIAKTYLPILNQILLEKEAWERDQVAEEIREVLGPIVILADPLSARSLAELLAISLEDIGERLGHLHSVLSIPRDPDTPIRLLHLSFRDFLTNADVSHENPFWIDEPAVHGTLARMCLELLSSPTKLKPDICTVVKPGTRRSSVGNDRIAQSIPSDMAYACKYWAYHITESRQLLRDDDPVHRFLRTHFLHWLEALSWLGRLTNAVIHIDFLRSQIDVHQGAKLLDFINDAYRFIQQNRHVIDLAPMQVYSSSLVFSPTGSIVRRCSEGQIPRWLDVLPATRSDWTPAFLRIEHESPVRCVDFSPDGSTLASASGIGQTVFLWNVATGELIDRLEGHDENIQFVKFSPDGQIIMAASSYRQYNPKRTEQAPVHTSIDNCRVSLWDTTTGQMTYSREGQGPVAFSPNGQNIALITTNGKGIDLWAYAIFNATKLVQDNSYRFTAIAYSANGRKLASASGDRSLTLWDTETGEAMLNYEGHTDIISALCFHSISETEYLLSASFDGSVRLWNATTGDETKKFQADTIFNRQSGIFDVAVSRPDMHIIAAAEDSGLIKFWDLQTGKEIQRLWNTGYEHTTIAFSPNGQILALRAANTVVLWDMKIADEGVPSADSGHRIWCLAYSSSGRLLASSEMDLIKIWNGQDRKETWRLEGHNDMVRDIEFSPNENLLASASDDGTVRLWNTATGELVHILSGHPAGVNKLAFSPSGEILASSCVDDSARLWDTKSGKVVQKLEYDGQGSYVIAFSPDGLLLASASREFVAEEKESDFAVRLWNVNTGRLIYVLKGHEDWITALTYSSSGQTLASGDVNGAVILWNLQTGEQILELRHDCVIIALVFVPQQAMIVACDLSGQTRVWDTTDSRMLLQFESGARIQARYTAIHGHTLQTNTGCYDLGLLRSLLPATRNNEPRMSLHEVWIKCSGEDVLWLPPQYRGWRAVFHENTFVIGQDFGELTFIGFDPYLIP